MTEQHPKIYSAKLTPEQNAAIARYESLCGMEPIDVEAFEAGEINAYQLWQRNLAWLEGAWNGVQNIAFPVPLEDVQVAWEQDKSRGQF